MNIGAVSKKIGFSVYTLHYYEKEGILKEVTRNDSGHRVYSEKDRDILQFIKCMRLTEMPIKQLKVITALYYEEVPDNRAKMEILKSHRNYMNSKLRELEETVSNINKKIDYYESIVQSLDAINYKTELFVLLNEQLGFDVKNKIKNVKANYLTNDLDLGRMSKVKQNNFTTA